MTTLRSVLVRYCAVVLLAQACFLGAQDNAGGTKTNDNKTTSAAPSPAPADSTALEPVVMVRPVYPGVTGQGKLQGRVVVRVLVDEAGDVKSTEVVESSDEALNQAALESMRLWKFKPFISHGKAIPVKAKLPVDFLAAGEIGTKATGVDANSGDKTKHVQVADKVMVGHLVHRVQPQYPSVAKSGHIQGTVILHAIIDKEGKIADLTRVSGDKIFTAAAIDAVRQWRYEPYLLLGEPVEVDTTVEVRFVLAEPPSIDRTH